MYSYNYEIQFIYTSIYESLSKDPEVTSGESNYWIRVLRKLNPKYQILTGGGYTNICVLAFLDGYFSNLDFCDAGWLLNDDRPSENPVWRRRVRHMVGTLPARRKRDLLRILTESPVYGVFVRNQLARG